MSLHWLLRLLANTSSLQVGPYAYFAGGQVETSSPPQVSDIDVFDSNSMTWLPSTLCFLFCPCFHPSFVSFLPLTKAGAMSVARNSLCAVTFPLSFGFQSFILKIICLLCSFPLHFKAFTATRQRFEPAVFKPYELLCNIWRPGVFCFRWNRRRFRFFRRSHNLKW